jgi:hypothetical protein
MRIRDSSVSIVTRLWASLPWIRVPAWPKFFLSQKVGADSLAPFSGYRYRYRYPFSAGDAAGHDDDLPLTSGDGGNEWNFTATSLDALTPI